MIQDSSDDEGSRSEAEEGEGKGSSGADSSSGSSSTSSDDGSGSSSGSGSDSSSSSDDEATEDESPQAKKLPAKKAIKGGGAASASKTGSVKSPKTAKSKKPPSSSGSVAGSEKSHGSISGSTSGAKKSKFFDKTKESGPPKKRPPVAQNGTASKKAKVGPDGKAVTVKKPPSIPKKVKVPGEGPQKGKKEKGLAPRPPAKKKEGPTADEKAAAKAEAKAKKAEEKAAKKAAAKPSAPRKPAKKKREITWEEEKEVKKNLKIELKKRQTDARTRVTLFFKRESRITPFSKNGASGSRQRDELSSSLPPEPSHSIIKDLSPEQGSRLVNSWNFLHTFARPLGLISVPTLPELTKALRTLDSSKEGAEREEADRLYQEICLTLVRAVAADVEALVGVRGSSQSATFQDLFSRKTGLVLPFNSLTWSEVARLCLLVAIYRELSFTDAHIHECLRGRANYRKNKAFLKLLKLRMEARKLRAKPAESKPEEEEPPLESEGHQTSTPKPAGQQQMITPRSEAVSSGEATAKIVGAAAAADVATPAAGSSDQAAGDVGVGAKPSVGEKKAAAASSSEATDGEKMEVGEQEAGEVPVSRQQNNEEHEPGEVKARHMQEDDDDEEDEEEEEEEEGMAELEVAKELEDLLASPHRSENEKRMAYLLKRLIAHSCSENVGVDGTQSLEVASSLVDYPMNVWQPIRVSTLATLLKDGVFEGKEGPELLARHVNLMCYNSFATNIEDSEPWSAADRFSAIFERLLKKWILDPSRPPLEALCEEPCHICGKGLDKTTDKVACSRCSALMHPWCLGSREREEAAQEGWCCSDCVALTLRKEWYPTVQAEPSTDDIKDLMYDSLPASLKRIVDVAKTVCSEWGPAVSFPPLLDMTINRTIFEMVKEDSELGNLISAVAILASYKESSLEQRLILLDALCGLASSAPAVRSFLDTQEHRVVALRKKLPEDEAVLRNELKTIGGDAAVLAWKDPLTEAPDQENGADEDEEAALAGICCVCQKSTADEADQSKVILCEVCPTEIHLGCLDASLTEAPKGDWYCPRCKANRNKKRKAKGPPRPEEMEDPLEKEREDVENNLFTALMHEKVQKIVEARRQAGGGNTSAPPAEDSEPKDTCEYCGFGELDICSPLVLGQSREETEEHVKMLASAEAREGLFLDDEGSGKRKRRKSALDGESLPPLVPYFPRKDSSHRTKLPANVHYPTVHERCAIQILGLRAHNMREREEGKGEKEERLIEDALRISGTRTFPLGEDRHGRCYWKMPGDEERLFVWVRQTTNTPASGETLPGRSTEGHWLCYESRKDIEDLVHYLNERDPTERVLKAALVEEFLGEKRQKVPHYDESLVIRKPPEVAEGEGQQQQAMDVVTDGEEGGASSKTSSANPAAEHKQQEANDHEARPPQSVRDDDPTTKSETSMDVDQAGPGNGGGGHGSRGGDDDEAGAPVALKLIEAKCQVELPPELLEVEIPLDLWGEDLELRAAIRKTRKFYTLALVDAKDRIWEDRSVAVKYEVFKGGDLLETSTALRAHKDFLFWFYSYDFRAPGIFTLKFSVVTEPYSRSIRPFCVRVTVRGHRAKATYGSAVNGLSFLNLSRGGRMTQRQTWEIHIPEGADSVAALRIALLQLKESLPSGALVESDADLATINGGGSSSKSSSSGAGKGAQFVWTEALEAQWTNHLMEATHPQHVMEDLILLESCLHPDWLKPWYGALRRSYASSHAHLLRSGTAGAVALHLFVLDKAILYDKERVVPRAMRSAGSRAQPAKAGRKPRRSYAESDEGDDDDEEYEEESESEEEDDPDDEDFTGRGARSRKLQRQKKAQPPARPQRAARERANKSYLEMDDDDFEEESDGGPVPVPDPGWSCKRCTLLNEPFRKVCTCCNAARDITRADAAASLERRVTPSQPEAGGGGGGGGDASGREDAAAATAQDADSEEEELEFEDEGFIKTCKQIIKKLWHHEYGYHFQNPVEDDIAPGYSGIIEHPMCLKLLRRKLKSGKYHSSFSDFVRDANLIFTNAERYNGEGHDVTKMAHKLKRLLDTWAAEHVTK